MSTPTNPSGTTDPARRLAELEVMARSGQPLTSAERVLLTRLRVHLGPATFSNRKD